MTSDRNIAVKDKLPGLNARQRDAILSESNRVLVLAGAGSGKTKTLLQKIIYLIDHQQVKPAHILAVTFSKNAANEMIDRLLLAADQSGEYEKIFNDRKLSDLQKKKYRLLFKKRFTWIDKITIRTFHSFAYKALKDHGVHEFDNQFKIIGHQKSGEGRDRFSAIESESEVLKKLLIELCRQPDYLLKLKRWLLDYLIDHLHRKKFTANNIRYEGRYTTLRGERVKSKSERDIADWFYRHNIQYVYEPVINFSDFDFRPDFYLPQADLYLEHRSEISYQLDRKIAQFQKANQNLVITDESIMQDSALFNLHMEKIIQGRLSEPVQPVTLHYEEEFKSYGEEINGFLRQVNRVIDMIKVENIDLEDVSRKAARDQHERVRVFYQLFKPIFSAYQQYCTNKSYLDFNDLISKAIDLLKHDRKTRAFYQNQYQYILVDEFQDVNNLQVELLKLLLTPGNKLFCVGDDWQSIYGFRGSEVGYIINFSRHFKNPHIIKLDLNYRSTDTIVGASNELIRHNKFLVDKQIKAAKSSAHKIVIYAANDPGDRVDFFITEVRRLQNHGYAPDDILVLYRRSKMYWEYQQALKKARLQVKPRTIHAAKGLEAKVVFILGMTDGSGGFPDIWLDDRIFQVIKKARYDLLMEEERRLFYVAITRAQQELYLLTERGNISRFIDEIPSRYTVQYQANLNPLVDEMVLCSSCNREIESHFSFCPFCGQKNKD